MALSTSADCLLLRLNAPKNWITGTYRRRVKRFSVEFTHGAQTLWAHCNNTGSMLGLLRPNASILLSPARNPDRKLPYTLERVWLGSPDSFIDASRRPKSDCWCGVNTLEPNRILKAAFHAGKLPFAAGYSSLKTEARYGSSRLDACLTSPGKSPLWIECKSVTLVEDGVAYFPDAKSDRASRHLLELTKICQNGHRGAVFFLVQRSDASCFAPADFIDPVFAENLCEAMSAGVEIYAWRANYNADFSARYSSLPILPFL